MISLNSQVNQVDLQGGVKMDIKKFVFNERINSLLIDPRFIEEGFIFAKKCNYTSITISDLNEQNNSVYFLDLSPFEGDRFIKELSISDNFRVGKLKLDAIYTMNNLISLSFTDKKINPDYSKLADLETLYIKYNGSLTNFSSLNKLTDLRIVSLKERDCSALEGLVSLTNLRISGSMESLHGIEKLSNIDTLTIFRSPKLNNIVDIGKLPKLRKLHIESCAKLRDFSFLANNNSIDDWFITDLDSISFVESMKKIRKIYFWNLKDGDISPALRSKSLEQIIFSADKRHYSHTQSEVKSILKSKSLSIDAV